MHSHNSWDLKSLNKRSLVLCFKKLEDRHFPPLSYFDFRNKIQTSSLDLVKTLNRYLKIWLVIVYWVERSFFFYLIFKISVSTHFQMPCAVETFIYFHLKFTKGKCTRGHIYKTKKTKQLLTSQKKQYWILFLSIDFTTVSGTWMAKKTSIAAVNILCFSTREKKKTKLKHVPGQQ